jgi:mRNA interferase MazF
MKRGTIVLTKFPFTDLSSTKRRPGIVVSATSNNKNDIIIAFISSVVPPQLEPTDYLFNTQHTDFTSTGLKKDSVIKLNKLATINASVLSGEIGKVSANTMQEIDKRLKIALGLN